jgi:hypothetical protein
LVAEIQIRKLRRSTISKSFTGGCACGAVRYEIPAEPMMMIQCQCRDCQRASGTGHASAVAFPRAALKVTGDVKQHTVIGDSGRKVHRSFCPQCGSPLFGMPDVAPQLVGVAAASLDDPAVFKPQMVMYASRAQHWDRVDQSLPSFPKLMPQP